MANKNTLTTNNTINNVGKASNKIKLNMYAGTLSGNIIDVPVIPPPPPPVVVCEPNALDFSCADNSQKRNS